MVTRGSSVTLLHVLCMQLLAMSMDLTAGVICRMPNAEREFRSAVYRVKHVLSVNMAAIEIIDISDK